MYVERSADYAANQIKIKIESSSSSVWRHNSSVKELDH
jgi:hypothetical protein